MSGWKWLGYVVLSAISSTIIFFVCYWIGCVIDPSSFVEDNLRFEIVLVVVPLFFVTLYTHVNDTIRERNEKLKKDYNDRKSELEKSHHAFIRKSEIEMSIKERQIRLESESLKRTLESDIKMHKIRQDIEQRNLESRLNHDKMQLELEYQDKAKELKAKYTQLVKKIEAECLHKEERIYTILKTTEPFKNIASAITDFFTVMYDDSIEYLRNKPNPAIKAAEVVRTIKQETKLKLLRFKEVEYKMDYLLRYFPHIADLFNSDEDLIAACEHSKDIIPDGDYDRRRDYITKEEFSNLSDSEKSQLALDKYIKGRKSNWQIGRDYEMSCAYQLRKQGYFVEMHGIKYGVHDFGRDLIASKEIGGIFGSELLIIQCKNWRHERIIRENVIMQLYGSTVEYAIQYNMDLNVSIRAVLMIPSYSQLSETAVNFAKRLKIEIVRMDYMEFPRIKCNVNGVHKIYHLPFDQQYDRAEIKNKDEFYAFTVDEAVQHGFVRAKRHMFN